MTIGIAINILQAFERYVDFLNDNGHDEVVLSIEAEDRYNWEYLIVTMCGHMGETYKLKVSVSEGTNELRVETMEGDNVFETINYVEEYEITEKEWKYIVYGE